VTNITMTEAVISMFIAYVAGLLHSWQIADIRRLRKERREKEDRDGR